MKRVKILYDTIGWAYYHDAVQIKKYAPKDWVVDIGPQQYGGLENYDLIMQFAYCYIDKLAKYFADRHWHVPIITSYNVGVGYNPISVLKNVVNKSDGVIINNHGMYYTFGRNPKTTCIPNGVDLNIFNIKNPISERKTPKVLWISSEFHKTIKGYEQFALPLKEKLEADGIECDFRVVSSVDKNKRMTQEELAKWYNTATIYAVTAIHEGTPNPALESSACGCTVVATPVGNMPELIINGYNGYLVDWNIESMYNGIIKAINNYQLLANNMQNIIKEWSWEYRSQWYYNFFEKVLSKTKKCRIFNSAPVKPEIKEKSSTNQHYEIFAYCSKNYLNAYNFSIASWTEKSNVDKITIYTDWDFSPKNSKIEIIKLFDKEDSNWVVGCERRLDAIKHFSQKYKNSGKNIIFMDMDCYLKSDVSEVFDKDFDIAITRLYTKESYANGTATDGMWFAKMTPGYDEFIQDWMKEAEKLKKNQNYNEKGKITYTQYSFTKVAKLKLVSSLTCNVCSLDEHIYNSEHSNIKQWIQDIIKYKPKVLHFKGGRFNDSQLVYKIMSLYRTAISNISSQNKSPVIPALTEPKLVSSKDRLTLWKRVNPVLRYSIIKKDNKK